MSELDDLSICKRIAEIEKIGHQHIQYTDKPFIVSMATHSEYNPLTDDALCFQLMVKYEVNVDSYLGVTSISSDYTNKPNIAQVSYMDYTINKAICLTIIKAHKDKS